MNHLETEIVVIGGGATGTGLVRDLAMRGFKTILVERGDLASGTTGRFHGLLHSGGRYVVKDPQAAQECIQENRILRKIMPFCIEDTGGLFVLTPWDDPNYVRPFLDGCQYAGIPCQEVELNVVLTEEPALSKEIIRAFRLPDASVDSFIAAEANAISSQEYQAQIFTYHPVIKLIQSGNEIKGVVCHNLMKDEHLEITADLVVNAAGAWVDALVNPAGIQIKMVHGKGTMIATNHRITNTVINRCKMPADGDIIVPSHTVSVLGTTDIPVSDPDRLEVESWEIDMIIQECEKVIPGISQKRFLRAWAGVRPLYQPEMAVHNRDISRAFVLLDHSDRDGMQGLVSITSGKWTTYRKMAEQTADLVCSKLKTHRKCRTHLEVLPDPERRPGKPSFHFPGNRLHHIEKEKKFGQIVCECELVTVPDIIDAWNRRHAQSLSDLRRDTRLGMGPCQGCFCTFRAASIVHTVMKLPIETTNQMMVDYANERWKGVKQVLWGQQLKQEYFNLLVYKNLLQLDRLNPLSKKRKESESFPNTEVCTEPHVIITETSTMVKQADPVKSNPVSTVRRLVDFDVVVIGMGLSGLFAALRLAKRGFRVGVIAKGLGAFSFHTGCIDILGYQDARPVISPVEAINHLSSHFPEHPYARFNERTFTHILNDLTELCNRSGVPFEGGIQQNWMLPTAVGALRPTCLAPSTMVAGDLRSKKSLLVIGFKNYSDFFPKVISDNLSKQGIASEFGVIEIPDTAKTRNFYPRRLAQSFEDIPMIENITGAISILLDRKKPFIPARIAIPAVMGIKEHLSIFQELQKTLKIPFCEIPTLPPSIPGIRLQNILIDEFKKNDGIVINGSQVVSAEISHSKVIKIFSEAAAGHLGIRAKEYILATGGIMGGGIFKPYQRPLEEPIFNLPVTTRKSTCSKYDNEFFSRDALPGLICGITTNSSFQPTGDAGEIIYENLRCIGTNLYGANYLEELSGEGIALMTGAWIGDNIL